MKYVKLLADVVLMDLLTGKTWRGTRGELTPPVIMTNKEFLRGRLCDLAFGTGYVRGQMQKKMVREIEAARVFVPFEDADHEVLCETIRNPSANMPFEPRVQPSILPFMDGVLEAPSKLPPEWEQAEREARGQTAAGDDGTKAGAAEGANPAN